MPERLSAAELAVKLNKSFKHDVIVLGRDLREDSFTFDTTGSLAFDLMLGGGFVVNQWNELIGDESSGKTAVALKSVAANQALDPDHETLWIAAEPFDKAWSSTLGVDMDRTYVVCTNVMEDAFQTIVEYLDNRAVDMVVLDSYPALSPSGEIEKTMEEFSVGLGARLSGTFHRKAATAGRRSLTEEDRSCTGLIINQWREKIGVMRGDNRTTPGGRAKNYFYVTRTELRRDEWIEEKDKKVGLSIKARTRKNKAAPPERVGVVDFYFEDVPGFPKGSFDTVKETTNIAVALEVVAQKGAYFYYNEERLGQGWDAYRRAVREDLDLQANISNAVRKSMGLIEAPAAPVRPPASAAVGTTRKLVRSK